jgi:uncharacterized protein (DUF433 family)
MPTIELTPQAYELLVRRARKMNRSPTEMVSELILSEPEDRPHPYVERRVGVLNGRPIIKGTRLPIWQIAVRLQLGDTPDDLVEQYSHISAAAIYDAISYFLDHRDEIEEEINANRLETVLSQHNATMDERGVITFHP